MTESNAVLRFVSRLQRLEALPRTGWLVSGVARPESVAAHIYEVSLVALWIADSIDDPVDVGKLARIALLHDVGEAITTDIPTPVKRLIGLQAVHDAERHAAEIVLQDAPPSWIAAVHEYEERESLEARIVKAADTIQMLARALAYQATGQGDVTRFFGPARPDYGIPFVRSVLDEIARRHREDDWFTPDFD